MTDSKDSESSDPKENVEPPASDSGVSKAVVSRLSLYLRELQHWQHAGQETISSTQLGRVLGFTDAQVRKDLANFGQFGYPGVGYRCHELIEEIRRILGTDRAWPVALVGCGHLGQALLGYKGFEQQGFRVVAAFDVDPAIIGKVVDGIPVHSLSDLPQVCQAEEIRMAVMAVPAEQAQNVAETLVDSGIGGILNFAPVALRLPNHVGCVGVDLAIELEQLAFAVVKRDEKS